jgi:Flp pilus assembly protein TadD
LFLFDYWPLARKNQRLVIVEKLPLIVLSVGVSVITYLAQHHGGAVAAGSQLPFGTRIANAALSYGTYLIKFVWPWNLAVFYPYFDPNPLLTTAAVFILIVCTGFALVKVDAPYLLMGWLWYLGTLVPVVGIVQAGLQSRADRYTYVPTIGLSIAFVWGIGAFATRHRVNQQVVAGLTISIMAFCAILTTLTVRFWRDSITLFQHAIDVTHDNYVAYNNLGSALKRAGRLTEAAAAFTEAVRIHAEDPVSRDNLGELQLELGELNDAKSSLQFAVRLKPDYVKAHVDLASALVRSGDLGGAESEYRKALALQPNSVEAHYGLAGVLMLRGGVEEAKGHFGVALPGLRAAVEAGPDRAENHYNLGIVFGLIGRTNEAITQFEAAVRLQPDDPEFRFNLGIALSQVNQLPEAAEQLVGAVQLRPNYASAHLNLARVLTALGRRNEAAEEFSAVLKLVPNSEEAKAGMRTLLGK